jgi:(p)ppGpp synthase/HD superfamily hydrolase
MNLEAFKEWCIDLHRKVNHQYSEYLPYEFHLRMVGQVAEDFDYLLDNSIDCQTGKRMSEFGQENILNFTSIRKACSMACYGHDLLEDVHLVSYNDISKVSGVFVADIIYACTNEKGKNRKERANDKYYEGIRNTPGAVFVKLCDRIANVQYSKMTKSRMFEMYKGENENFMTKLGYYENFNNHDLLPMFNYLENLFKN